MPSDENEDPGTAGRGKKKKQPKGTDKYALERLAAIRRAEKVVGAREAEVEDCKTALKDAKAAYDLAIKNMRENIKDAPLFDSPEPPE